jgi:hypothetical protein
MTEPVVFPDGWTYEKDFIFKWLTTHKGKSPINPSLSMKMEQGYMNHALREEIERAKVTELPIYEREMGLNPGRPFSVKIMTDPTHPKLIMVSSHESIESLRAKVAAATKKSAQTLSYMGKQLLDGFTVGFYKICEGAKIWGAAKFDGGALHVE